MARFAIVFFAFLVIISGCEEKAPPAPPVAQAPKQITAQDVEIVLEQARTFARQGKYEEALEKHLVYFEEHAYVQNAIAREKQIKNWSRTKKIALIEMENPEWKDLSEDWVAW